MKRYIKHSSLEEHVINRMDGKPAPKKEQRPLSFTRQDDVQLQRLMQWTSR